MKKYNDFILERQFETIINEILLIVENNTFEWDLSKDDKWSNNKIKSTDDKHQMEWDFTKKSTKEKLKNLLKDLPKEKIKHFFNKFIKKIRFLPKITRKKVLAFYLFVFLSLTSFNYLVDNNKDIDNEIKKEIIHLNDLHSTKKTYKKEVVKTQKDLLKDLAFKESSGNWKSINRYGYIGLYQFGKSALKDVGLKHINHKKFKENPNIFPVAKQNEAMIKLLKLNKHYLRNYMHYVGKEINGIEITESGLLTAAHLVGNRSVKKFLKSNGEIDKADRNGTKCSDYMSKFSGYQLDI